VKYQSIETEVGSVLLLFKLMLEAVLLPLKRVPVHIIPIAISCQGSPEISLKKKFSVKYPIVLLIIQKVILLSITKISKYFIKIMPTS
jgi:hypothetical protein